jgi:hypothetical protein
MAVFAQVLPDQFLGECQVNDLEQLFVDGVHHGVHVFLVNVRDENGNLTENVRVADCGIKSGLQGTFKRSYILHFVECQNVCRRR